MDLVGALAAAVADLRRQQDRVLVGFDGPDAAGKTTLADRIAVTLPGPVLRVSGDDFQRPVADRYRRGDLSPEGYYRDAFDAAALRESCLVPFRDGAGRIGTAGGERRAATADVARAAVLVVDGVFLLRSSLCDLWTLSVYVHVDAEESLRRARTRDLGRHGTVEEVERRYRARYLPGQALYRDEADPVRRAHVVVDNGDVGAPVVRRWGRTG